MKKIAAFLLALLCVATLASCNNENHGDDPDDSKDPGYSIDSGSDAPDDSTDAPDESVDDTTDADTTDTQAPVETDPPVTEEPAVDTTVPYVDPADIVFTPVENKVVYVSAANVNIRKTPEVIDGNVVTSVKYGDSFVCLATSDNWYKITYADQECYISAHYVTFDNLTKDDFEATGDYVCVVTKVVGGTLTVRTGPSMDTEIKGYLKEGDIVTRLAKNENWSKISYDGGVAYVSNAYVQVVEETTVPA